MGFSWDKGMDWLWRERVELIGDQRGDEMGESIEHGAVLGRSEGRELLDVTDDGLDDARPIEQSLSRNETGSRFMLQRTRRKLSPKMLKNHPDKYYKMLVLTMFSAIGYITGNASLKESL
jgi:hypothetical protein